MHTEGPAQPDSANRWQAADAFPELYDRLRAQAERYMKSERAGHTLQPTAIVHEAYVQLSSQDRQDWRDQEHFLATASFIMRRLLREHARHRNREKRGGGWGRVTLSDVWTDTHHGDFAPEELEAALAKLAEEDERKAAVVTLRFFGGLSNEAIAQQLGVTRRTVDRDWRFARAWLMSELDGAIPDETLPHSP